MAKTRVHVHVQNQRAKVYTNYCVGTSVSVKSYRSRNVRNWVFVFVRWLRLLIRESRDTVYVMYARARIRTRAQMETKYFWIHFFSLEFRVERIFSDSFCESKLREKKNADWNSSLRWKVVNRNFGIRIQQKRSEKCFQTKNIFIFRRNEMNGTRARARSDGIRSETMQ